MALVLLSGTKMEPDAPKVPLNKPFIYLIGLIYLYAMHFYMPNIGGAGLHLPFNNTTWMVLSFAVAVGFYQLANQRILRYTKLTISLFCACLLMTIPVFYHDASFSQSYMRLIGLWSGFIFFLMLQQFRFSNKEKQSLLWLILLGVLIEAFIGIYQFLGNFQPAAEGAKYLRPYGTFRQPNVMASFLATGLMLSAYLLARQATKYGRNVKELGVLFFTPLITLPLLVVLASRTAWLGTILGVALILPYLYKYASKKRFYTWVSLLIIGLTIGISTLFIQSTGGVVSNKADLESPRRYTFPQTVDMVIEKPFTGYGYGKFEEKYALYTARQHQLNPSYHPGLPSMDHPHNELLYWAVEGGLVPVAGIFIAAAFVLLRISQTKKGTRLALFALLVPIALHTQLEYPFYHSTVHWITFLILLYWIDQRSIHFHQLTFSLTIKRILRISSLLVPALTTAFMLTSLQTNYVLAKFERTKDHDPALLEQVTNLTVWKDRFDWDTYTTYLKLGLDENKSAYIQPYIDWSLEIIKRQPRPIFYRNLIFAYQFIGEKSRADQIRAEAEFLFPNIDFSHIRYENGRIVDTISSVSSSVSTSKP